jgi:hypothetical protein
MVAHSTNLNKRLIDWTIFTDSSAMMYFYFASSFLYHKTARFGCYKKSVNTYANGECSHFYSLILIRPI